MFVNALFQNSSYSSAQPISHSPHHDLVSSNLPDCGHNSLLRNKLPHDRLPTTISLESLWASYHRTPFFPWGMPLDPPPSPESRCVHQAGRYVRDLQHAASEVFEISTIQWADVRLSISVHSQKVRDCWRLEPDSCFFQSHNSRLKISLMIFDWSISISFLHVLHLPQRPSRLFQIFPFWFLLRHHPIHHGSVIRYLGAQLVFADFSLEEDAKASSEPKFPDRFQIQFLPLLRFDCSLQRVGIDFLHWFWR